MGIDICEIGNLPPPGVVPRRMHAQVIRDTRLGSPSQAFRIEQVDVPAIGPDECLVAVMAAGINYNNVWAALGSPLNVVDLHRRGPKPVDFHIGGSDASGIVYQVGRNLRGSGISPGDEVVIHCGQWDANDPAILAGGDPILAPSNRIWGYEVNFGSFAQFTRVQAHQLLPKPPHLSWEEAASYMLVGATAYRMLHGFAEHRVRSGDVVLIWGGAGGLGCMAVQLAKLAGALPVVVVSSEARGRFCEALGARGYLCRRDFDHWGPMPDPGDEAAYARWLQQVRAFGRQLWTVVGDRRNPRIVIEHSGEDTIPTSCYVCDRGGMVVICGGSTGYLATVDLRFHWMHQKRLQGSHFANDAQAAALNRLVAERKIDPCLSRTFRFDEIPLAHQMMLENLHPPGNMAALVGASAPGLGRRPMRSLRTDTRC